MPNLFIVLDGLDGSGKGEMITRLHNYLFNKSKRFRILTTREPTYGKYGKKIRELLEKDTSPMENAEKMTELYVKDREDHVNKIIKPFLSNQRDNECNILLSDRYYYSTIAFQHTQGMSLDRLIKINKQFPKPDLCIILDLPPELALNRISKTKRKKEKFEKLQFMRKLRKNFLELKNHINDNITIIDASKSKKDVFKEIREEVDKLLLSRVFEL